MSHHFITHNDKYLINLPTLMTIFSLNKTLGFFLFCSAEIFHRLHARVALFIGTHSFPGMSFFLVKSLQPARYGHDVE